MVTERLAELEQLELNRKVAAELAAISAKIIVRTLERARNRGETSVTFTVDELEYVERMVEQWEVTKEQQERRFYK